MTTTRYPRPTLRENGDNDSAQVRHLQQLLNDHKYKVNVDGIFGQKTRDAVKQFQRDRNIDVDGVVGKNTWEELKITYYGRPLLKQGGENDFNEVKSLQQCLNDNGNRDDNNRKLVVDGVFGPSTAQAVKDLQRKAGITVNGVVNGDTWKAFGH